MLLENNIQPPATPGGTVTNSTMAPFFERLMMYCNYLLSEFAIGGGAFSAGFSLRNDLITKNTIFSKDIFQYQLNETKLMIDKGCLKNRPKWIFKNYHEGFDPMENYYGVLPFKNLDNP